MNFRVFLPAVLCLLLCAPSFAAAAEKIDFSADSMSGSIGENADYTKLTGHARIKTESLEISADSIELSGKNFRYIVASGTVDGTHSADGLAFSCGSLRYDRERKVSVFSENVHLVDSQNGVEADAQRIEYNEETGVAVMQIAVKLVQKENVCTAAFAVYRKKQQLLELSGSPQIVRGKDTFRAQEITLNLETDEITLDGRVRGTVTDSENGKNTDE
ncbi:LptA/OstA family protein [Treponema brennaborense]|uniref:OstA family protein n=1 Tax=Treponema brennaborense (strain DSM 12168 / CIP 105900 / DD5/3) TaxID=906968 RepID=F4LJ56_TREBD|nr:LptA/OstA family protein [Treponema brennaborense]AEE16313.1 OstA family protein [Treponema brennaborense DSM 12168]